MTDTIKTESDIPDARFYVVARGRFPYNWRKGKGTDDYIIVPCKNRMEALIVEDNACTRGDLDDIKTVDLKPTLLPFSRRGRPTRWLLLDRLTATRWYTVGGFRK